MSSASQVAQSTPYPAGNSVGMIQAANDLIATTYDTDPTQKQSDLAKFRADMVDPTAAANSLSNFTSWNGSLPLDTGPLDVTTRLAQLAVMTSPVKTKFDVVSYFLAMSNQLDQADPGLAALLTQLQGGGAPPPLPPLPPTPPPTPSPTPTPQPGGVQIGPGGIQPITVTTTTTTPVSTGTKVAIGAGAVAGTGFLALLWYSLSHGLTLVQGAQSLVEGGKYVKKTIARRRRA